MVVSAKYLIVLQLGDYPSHGNPKNAVVVKINIGS